MGCFLYILIQCTWGLFQTISGGIVFLWYWKQPHFFYHRSVVTVYPCSSSLSLGLFVFLSSNPPKDRSGRIPDQEIPRRLLVHEYGHTVQSLFLGPLYLPVVGLPSALWNNLPFFQQKWRKNVSYFSFLPEKTANALGEWATKEHSIGFAEI